jgi:predicted ABC-type transport system involved in lysophospholipase L1 biosynthesis ATPase subunit
MPGAFNPWKPSAMSNPILQANGLHKTYRLGARPLEVLCGVDVTVHRREFLALRGASGAGKSTLLHLLAGLDKPDAGSIHFAGVNLASLSGSDLVRLRNRRIGLVFQAYHLLPELDALENVCLPARISRQPAGPVVLKARQLLERVGLKDRMEHRPYELSGGEQQRVAIARSLINDPELLLADEPTGNLDSHTGAEIMNLLCDLRTESGVTLIIATHDNHVADRAPRSIELVDGLVAGAAIPGIGVGAGG